jgi:putative yapH protein|uniref:Neck appendage like protein n=1 Tax=Siphoviridae sp. ct6rT12 TaxID=2825346 RepID=A0A8S5V993_9CAUD|nr:MAG TPA: Neck appendage like protein [Siphoviridae sp. ct6rT12]DAI56948.1 MAG TPA: Neck appendage like protein [Bacteriophage sp.]
MSEKIHVLNVKYNGKWVGIPAIRGAKGDKGDPGERGRDGAKGDKGDRGPQGEGADVDVSLFLRNDKSGTVRGNLTVTGEIVSNDNITAYSDIRLKTNIAKIDNALSKVCFINGYIYDMNGKKNTGVIAQEVQKVLPEAISITDTKEKYLSVAYGNLVGLLIEAIKELKQEVEVLKNDFTK